MIIGYHKMGLVSIAHGKFCGYFPPLGRSGIYWQYPLPPMLAWACMGLHRPAYIYRKEGALMKIVVLRSPAIIAPILRRMFGIRKEKRR